MNAFKEGYPQAERRKYVRLDSVFPVQFQLVSLNEKQLLSDWQQGFTNNVSKGGLCLFINNLKPEHVQLIKENQAKLSLKIEMPLARCPVNALSRVAWSKEILTQPNNKYLVGLSYERIDAAQNKKIMRYAWAKKIFFPTVVTIIIILALGFAIGSYLNLKLIKGSKALLQQLVTIVQESSIAKQKIKRIAREKDYLQLKIQAIESRLESIEKDKIGCAKDSQCLAEAGSLINKLTQEKSNLQEQLIGVQQQENIITEDLLRLDKKKADLEKANLDKIYQKIVSQQNPHTGLVANFGLDHNSRNKAFVYEQSLVSQAYTNFSDFERARRMWEFFDKKAKRVNGLFLDAYFVRNGRPADYSIHTNPNIWLGLAILQYNRISQDYTYLDLAESIAQALIELQGRGQDGAIRDSLNEESYSVENNLDAYVFFNGLYKLTKEPEHLKAGDKLLNWLVLHSKDSNVSGKVYVRSVLVFGPEKLIELGANPDRILEIAQQKTDVAAIECLANIILAFERMVNFYYSKEMFAKARSYEMKADEYLAKFTGFVLPAKGESRLSLADSVYILFANYNYNALELKK